MEVENRSHSDDYSFYDDDNDHEKTYVTVNADSFNEKDFNNLLNCLDKIHESENRRRTDGKVIKNYCVQVPYVDHSIVVKDENESPGDDFDRTCDEMRSNISQMFSYFDEDVRLNYDDCDKSVDGRRLLDHQVTNDTSPPRSESFREKFLRNRRKIKEMTEPRIVDTKPIIRGVIKKPHAPVTRNNSLNKNQIDKIMNEFNRVKINYYSKDNYVEFTNIDYFYCDSDLESTRSETVGRLKRNVLSKFEPQDVDRKSPTSDVEVVPKNSVRDKIDLFTRLDVVIQPYDGTLQKSSTAPARMTSRQNNECASTRNIIKNSSATNKNQNKCFIKDINNSLLCQQVENDDENQLLDKIVSYAHLNDIDRLIQLERIVNKFDMSLLHTIDGLMSDDAFTLVGNRMRHLNVETRPSIERFNEMFDDEKIDARMARVGLSVVDGDKTQLQMQVEVVERATTKTDCVEINVIFMAQYASDSCVIEPPMGGDESKNQFFIYFTSLFEVQRELIPSSFINFSFY